MAIWYTDNLTGNDTTGDGTIATPYKTINKAMTVGSNGDEIRVAGSGFTALPGTCSHTQRGGTSWNTSQSLVGLLVPGDIITYNDPNFGDQKFFYKVFSVSPTGFVTDAATNFDENVAVTISKVTTQHYYTTVTNQTLENIAISGKFQFDIRGGWTNSFTAQDGWTAMTYHSTATATAVSGTAFTAPTGSGLYTDRFMFTHLTTGMSGSVNTWYPGSYVFIYSPSSSTATFGASPLAHPTYTNKDLYLSNTRLSAAFAPQYAEDGSPAVKYDNCWYMRGVLGGTNTGIPIEITNLYTKSNNVSANAYQGNANGISLSSQTIAHNVTLSSFLSAGSVEYNGFNDAFSSIVVKNSVNKVGLNASGLVFQFNRSSNGPICMLNLPGQNIESWIGDTTTSGLAPIQTPFGSSGPSNFFGYIQTIGYVKDSEGFKSILGNGQIAFADPTQFSTGTNSLRLSKPKAVSNTNTLTPIESFFVDSATTKTITIRCKADVAGNVVFALFNSPVTGNYNAVNTTPPTKWAEETKTVGTDWTDVTYTGLSAYNASLFLNSFQGLGVETGTLPGKYIWIDSVTIS